jgi:hypothetical protein
MRFLPILFALSLSPFVMACSTSSPLSLSPSPALQAADAKETAAEAQLRTQLDHPAPPSRLTLCQDGSTPQMVGAAWECPPPPSVALALQSGTPLEQRARLIEALRNEVDLRFELLHWPPPQAGAAAPAANSSPP